MAPMCNCLYGQHDPRCCLNAKFQTSGPVNYQTGGIVSTPPTMWIDGQAWERISIPGERIVPLTDITATRFTYDGTQEDPGDEHKERV